VQTLGEGSYGQVSLWKHKLQGNKVAVKRMPYKNTKDSIKPYIDINYLSYIADEVKALNYVKRKLAGTEEYHFFGHLRRYTNDDTYFYLIYDYYTSEVDKYIKSFSEISSAKETLVEKFAIIAQLAFAVKGLQKIGVSHNDLKPANIMVNEEGCLKIIDFGLWRPYVTKNKGCVDCVCTWVYASPEIINEHESGWNSDSWSVGTIIYELLFGQRIFDKHPEYIPKGEDFTYMIKKSSMDSIFLHDVMKNEVINTQIKSYSNLNEILGLLKKKSDERTTAEDLYKSFKNAFDKRIKGCSK